MRKNVKTQISFKKTNTVYCILPPFWVGACLVRHKLSLCITNLCPRRRPIACPRRIASLPHPQLLLLDLRAAAVVPR